MDAKQHTLQPIVTGATCIAFKYKDGVLMVTDTLASYGSQARYKDVRKIKKVGNHTLIGCSGEFSDFQYLGDMLDDLDMEDWLHEDGCDMGPKQYSSYIGRVMYNRRNKFNPLYLQLLVAGKKKDEPTVLGYVDHQGTAFDEDFIATGFGSYLAMPILRNDWKADLTLDQAKKLAEKCMQVCFYRDCRGFHRIQISYATKDGVTIEEPYAMDHYWGHTAFTKPSLLNAAVADSW